MTTPYHSHVLRHSLDFLYARQGFERTKTFVPADGFSFVTCPCFYCGDIATSEDHAYPIVALRQIYGLTDLPPARLLVIVPACHECNTILGDRVFASMPARKRYIKTRLRKRYKRLLAIPEWHPHELQALNPAFRAYVQLGIDQQERLHKRLEW